MTVRLNPKQEFFCREYIIDLNGAQAAIRAGYSEKGANAKAAQLLAIVSIQERVKVLKDERSLRTEITADMVIRELASIGFSRIDDFATVIEETRTGAKKGEKIKYKTVHIKNTNQISNGKIPAIASIKQGQNGIELKLHDKVKALELLGRHTGAWEKDNDQSRPVIVPTNDLLNAIAAKINS